jgi:hypothetical protein
MLRRNEKEGSMEDLAEGKFFFPGIHSIHAAPENTELVDILKQRSEDDKVKLRAVPYSTWGQQGASNIVVKL